MKSRDIVRQNIEFACDSRIAFNFTNGSERLNDFVSAGCQHDIEPPSWTEDRFEYYKDIWGTTWRRIIGKSELGEVYEPALSDWKDLDAYTLPDIANPKNFRGAARLSAENGDQFKYGNFWGIGWIFTIPQSLRGLDNYLMDLVTAADEVKILHDRIAELLEAVIDEYGKAGMDGFIFGEDLGLQDRLILGRDRWVQTFKPYYARLTERAHRYGMKVIQHTCGYNWELIDDLCEAGIDCLQLDQPLVYDLDLLSAKLRSHGVGLFSPCDIQSVLPTGDRDLIEAESRRLVELFEGGFIAKNYPDLHGIGVETDWDAWAYEAFIDTGV